MEILVRVDTSLLGRSPACRVHACRNLRWVCLLPPVDEEGDSVLGLWDAAKLDGCASGGGRSDLYWGIIRNHALADIHMMGVEVVGDITLPSSPRLESLELTLRLAHVAVEVVEVTQVACLGAGIGVGWVETLVVLDKDEDSMLPRFFEKVKVVV